MLFQLNPSSSMIINRARLTSAAGETRDRVNDTNARRSSLVRLKTDCMLHIVLLKSMLHNTSHLLLSLCVGKNRNAPHSRYRYEDMVVFLVHCNRVSAGASGNVLKPFFGHCIDQPNDEPRLRSSANTDCRSRSKESDAGDRPRIPSSSDRNTTRNWTQGRSRPALESLPS